MLCVIEQFEIKVVAMRAYIHALALIIFVQILNCGLSQRIRFPEDERRTCLRPRRFQWCHIGFVEDDSDSDNSKSLRENNSIERRLFTDGIKIPTFRKFRLTSRRIRCCRVNETDNDNEPQIISSTTTERSRRNRSQRQRAIRNRRRNRRRRNRNRRRRGKFRYLLDKYADALDDIRNTSITYRQYDGHTWKFKPFKFYSRTEEPFERYRTRDGPNRDRDLDEEKENESLPSISTTRLPEVPQNMDVETTTRKRRPIRIKRPEKLKISKESEIDSPYIVSLKRNDVHFCSGVIVDSKHVLTAANCFLTREEDITVIVDPKDITVSPISENRDDVTVEHICVHNTVPEMVKELNEVAILTLAQPLVFSGDFFPARILWEGGKVDDDSSEEVQVQWVTPSLHLDSASVIPLSRRICRRRHDFFLRRDEHCLQVVGKGACSTTELIGGVLERPSGLRGDNQVCGIVTETSCPLKPGPGRKNPVSKISPIPKWIYHILTSNSYKQCF